MATAAQTRAASAKKPLAKQPSQAELDRIEEEQAQRRYLDADGEILHYNLKINRGENRPKRLQVTVNNRNWVIEMGKTVRVPWFVVTSLADREEVRYTPETDEQGRLEMVPDRRLADPFEAHALNPAPGMELPWPRKGRDEAED